MKDVKVTSDGACRGNGKLNNIGGWGVVLRCDDKVKKLRGHKFNTTNNQMEIIAAIQGLKALTSKNVHVTLISDSAYVINCLEQGWYNKWKRNGWKTATGNMVANKALWIELIQLKESFSKIDFTHVAGHNGDEDNEIADSLANQAMDEAMDNEEDGCVE